MAACRLVSHRGEHDNRRVRENTTAAFDRVRDAGLWGLELDVRWTRDAQPVVFHDPDTGRLYGGDVPIEGVSRRFLSREFPEICGLDEVVARYGGRLHLMVELKDWPRCGASSGNDALGEIFSPLVPGKDYHLLSLDPGVLERTRCVPPPARLPIAVLDVSKMSDLALRRGYGGVTGHFALMTTRRVRRHHGRGQGVGTGFANSEACLHREIRRGVDWIFSDRAAALQAAIRRRLR
jgi:glycerophosphoryl diester phosphodiesterase